MLLLLRTYAHIIQFTYCAPPLPVPIPHFQKLHKLFCETNITKKRASTEKLYSKKEVPFLIGVFLGRVENVYLGEEIQNCKNHTYPEYSVI